MTTIFTIFGTLGALSFAICSLPSILKAYRTKKTKDISVLFLYLSITGNIFSALFVGYTNYMNGFIQWPLYFNYGIALILVIVLLLLKFKYDKNT